MTKYFTPGSGIAWIGPNRPSPRVDKLAKLYRELEALQKMADPPRGEFLRLASAFAELRAHYHVGLCERLYEKTNDLQKA